MATLLQQRLEKELLSDLERGTIVWNELGTVNRAAYARRLGVTKLTFCESTFDLFDVLGPRKAPAKAVLRSLLEEDFRKGGLVYSKPGFINKLHYARQAGCSNTQYHKDLFEEYEAKAGDLRTAVALEELLSRDYDIGNLSFSRGGKIDRTSYAIELGVAPSALTPYIAMFSKFEERLGGAKRYRANDIRRMAEWLEANRRAGTLRFRPDGKVVRNQFKDAFAITFSDFEVRFPDVGALLARYDGSPKTEAIPVLEDEFPKKVAATAKARVAEKSKLVSCIEDVGAPTEEVAVDRGSAPSASSAIAATVVERFPALEKHQSYDRHSTRGQLVAMLNAALLQDDIPRSRGGKIDRRGLCRRFGFANSAMNHYRNILADYESATGGLVNVHERRIPEMESWLRSSMEQGTLEVRDGKIERRTFYRHFDLSQTNAILVRNPDIRKLLEKYEDEINTTGYLPKGLRREIDILRAALDSDPPIFKTGLSYDRTTLAKITGISIGRLVRPPFKELLKDADEVLRRSVEDDPLCKVFGGRRFSFRDLLEVGWSDRFLTRLAEAFQRIYQSKLDSQTKVAYNNLRELLRFIGSSGDPSCCAVQSGLNTGNVRLVREKDWTLGTQLYASWVDNRDDLKGSAPDTKLSAATSVLRHLGNAGVLPELEMALRAKGEASEHRRTLAQEPARDGVDDYLAFATAMLRDAAKQRQIDLEENAETGFLATLRSELASTQRSEGDTPAIVILGVLKRRLQSIKDALAGIYSHWRQHWERGQDLLHSCEPLGNEWSDLLISGSRNETLRKGDMRTFFPIDDRDRARANYIRLISDYFGGLIPSNGKGTGLYGQFFEKRALEIGGKTGLQAFIYPHPDAVGATLLLALCESGINVAVGRTLFTDAMEASNISGATHVSGHKARARGKPIHAHLDDRSHAVMGMRWLIHASQGLRALLPVDDQNLLFVMNTSRSGAKPVEEYFLRDLLKRVVADIPELADLNVTPAMLRPTILLIAALEGDPNAHASSVYGQHSENTNKGYTGHPPTRFMHDESIRAFVDGLELVSVHLNEDVQEWLGYSKAEVEAKIDDVMKTGLGTFCRDLQGRPGNDGAKCKTFDCWNGCPQLIVVARKRDLAMLIIWKTSLLEAEATWIRDRPERWYGLWFPWLEFIAAVERKILLTTMGKIWREAVTLAEEIMTHPNFKPRRPY
ncbi:hypothetical protein [Rhizobium leguminosarum]|uniref:hypothetical protein n=1 Tax=Rhizobium leguminosarum TaxID=384 RepID=UPI001031E419|nr:hypothetical protein [Rhizobium leguminosarum]TAY99680.1 hypothetical protein ELH79_14845 [Rhizobium leguminosarum]TAZ10550.1 hypothetical protein ELH78_15730 [Rhizobium leguminosarum]